MKVAFVLCPGWDTNYMACSLALLSAQLKRYGHTPLIFDFNKELSLLEINQKSSRVYAFPAYINQWTDAASARNKILAEYRPQVDALIDRILSSGARVIGFSTYFSNFNAVMLIAAMLKQKDPGITTILGGPSCFDFTNCLDYLKNEQLDAVAYGEAAESFPLFVSTMEKHGLPSPVPGILMRDGGGHTGSVYPPETNLEELSHPDFSGFQKELYQKKTVHMSRGCVRRCAFCDEWSGAQKYHSMSGKRFFEQICYQLERDPLMNNFHFTDNLINGAPAELLKFCDLCVENRLNIKWGAKAIISPQMEPPLLEKMKLSGCEMLYYGMESASPQVLNAMNKPTSIKSMAKVIKHTYAAGIETQLFCIIGYPTETEDNFQETLNFFKKNRHNISHILPSLCLTYQNDGRWEGMGLSAQRHFLFWETKDKQNTFPIRLNRLIELIRLGREYGIKISFDEHLCDSEDYLLSLLHEDL
ncbi:MAG: hypothetical protein A2X34_04910 [Elusimicrobia bacterium GWC2_51_8]|nr:MAG: hypothetical protein A2X33_05830 [Elusimicrobia bacterium GWA2_51_34]OGR63068.1 MAG: hypothetical protein A2X34_04910 [Elusimicrobia bacterium GWC2_51_8]OGR88166.1 MAG: hypothetical protein A2021_00975 [Elusimicrobia bacterium GWF2_52_66]HAF95369.1 hypothetical protein [Elusimicrobiota bacterium]HCE98767.1 hypothetical protein [Elusimicrobiota bacterium]